jgi:predicted HicB family RNase H-like nuclease
MRKSTLTIRVPEELKDRIETLAAQQGVSINQFAMYAFTKEIGELETGQAR